MSNLIERERCSRCGELAIFLISGDSEPVRLCKGCLATFDKLFNGHTAGSPDNNIASLRQATDTVIQNMNHGI